MKSIQHIEIGKGNPLILLHGFCETNEIWQDFVEPLAETHRVLLPNLPGFGNSPLLEPLSLEIVAKNLWEWVDHQCVNIQPIIIGHSLGGYITLEMMQLRPNGSRAFGLFHSTAMPDSDEKKRNRKKTHDFVSRNGIDIFLDSFVPSLFDKPEPKLVKIMRSIANQTKKDTFLAYTMAMYDRPAYTSILQRSPLPILFIAGEHDSITPIADLREQAEMAKNGMLAVIPNCGHLGMLEAPKEAVQSIIQFVHSI